MSVVIPVLNAASTLPEQLQALTEQDYRGASEVIIVENGSTDGSAEVAGKWSSKLPLSIVDASARKGISFAVNRGWKAAGGDLVAICDADDVVSAGWLSALAGAAPAADVLGGPYETGRLNVDVIASWNRPHLGPGPWQTLDYLHYFFAGNTAVWLDVLEALGGFNEDYQIGANDVEFCWRASLAGYSFGFVPEAVVHYRYRQGLRGLAAQAYRYGRSEPHLYRDFRSHGMPSARTSRVILALGWLLVTGPMAIISRSLRGRWLRVASHRLGRLSGSLRHRVLYV